MTDIKHTKHLATLILTVVCLLVGYLYQGSTTNNLIKTTYVDLGTVLKVDQCKLGRHRYVCRVVTDKYILGEHNLGRYPDRTVLPGDSLRVGTRVYDRGRKLTYCRGNRCGE